VTGNIFTARRGGRSKQKGQVTACRSANVSFDVCGFIEYRVSYQFASMIRAFPNVMGKGRDWIPKSSYYQGPWSRVQLIMPVNQGAIYTHVCFDSGVLDRTCF
jgi:hypothetical protein